MERMREANWIYWIFRAASKFTSHTHNNKNENEKHLWKIRKEKRAEFIIIVYGNGYGWMNEWMVKHWQELFILITFSGRHFSTLIKLNTILLYAFYTLCILLLLLSFIYAYRRSMKHSFEISKSPKMPLYCEYATLENCLGLAYVFFYCFFICSSMLCVCARFFSADF